MSWRNTKRQRWRYSVKNKKMVFKCAGCGAHTVTLHEIFFGRGNRDICVEYNIQVPLCIECHKVPHGTHSISSMSPLATFNQNECKHYFCDILKIDPVKTALGVQSKTKRYYLKEVKEKCRIALLKMLV